MYSRLCSFFLKLWEYIVLFLYEISFRVISKSFISFSLVGLIGAISQLFLTNILLEFFNFDLNLSLIISIIFSVNIAFFLNNLLTFKKNRLKGLNLINGIFKNIFFNSILIFWRIAIAIFLVKFLSINISLAQILSILICLLGRYFISLKFIWK